MHRRILVSVIMAGLLGSVAPSVGLATVPVGSSLSAATGSAAGTAAGPANRSVGQVATRHAGTGADIGIESSFAGLNFDETGGSSPPDVQVAAGPNAIFEVVNVAGRIWTKGGALVRTVDLTKLFATGRDDLTDPRVIYDAQSSRWFVSILNVTRSRVQLVVSATDDPTGDWTRYTIPATPNSCPDQPKIGVADSAVIITADFFDSACTSDEEGGIAGKYWVLDKAKLLAGGALSLRAFGPDTTYHGIISPQSLTATDTAYVAAIDWENDPGHLHISSISGPPVAGMAIPTHDVAIRKVSVHTHGNQPGPIDLEAEAGKIDDAAYQSGVLSLAIDDTCTPEGDTAKHACARIVRISTTSWTVLTDVDFGLKGQDIAYPALRPDTAGNLDLVFGHSSNSIFPSTSVATLLPDGTWSDSTKLLAAGTASVNDAGDASPGTLARYGDYFGAAVDPSDPDLIWVAGEIGKETTNGDWSTVIGSVRFSGGPPLGLSASATAIAWGTGVTFSIHLNPDNAGGTGAGRTVHLQRSADHATWASIADLTTDTNGNARFVYRPVTNAYYRVVFDGAADHVAATSAEQRVTVRQILLLRPDNAGGTKRIRVGSAVTFTALVRPARADVPPGTMTVQLWEFTGSWQLVDSSTVKPDAAGKATVRVQFADDASYYVRAIANPTPVNANSAWSPIQRYDTF